jgi:hypothetical protein
MRSNHDFTNSHFTGPIAIRPGFDSRSNSGQAIAISLAVSHEDQPLITNVEVAALMMLGLVAIVSTGLFGVLVP